MNGIKRGLVSIAFALAAIPAFAQYQTPVVDGTVNVGEYAHANGNWSMTWDATYLYIAKTNIANTSFSVIVYLDTDPVSTPTAGTNANGNFQSYGVDTVGDFKLPFRADARVTTIAGSQDLRTRDGSGGWSTANSDPGDLTAAQQGTTREIRIRWAAIPGLASIPSTFNWMGFEYESGVTILDTMPAGNLFGFQNHMYAVASTADGAASDPFGDQQSVYYVTSHTMGSGGLDSVIASSESNATASRRFFVFNAIDGNTITTSSDLPLITKTTTIDATTATGYTTTPLIVVAGFSTNINNDHGIRFDGCSGCVVRGLVLRGHGYGVHVNGGSNTIIAGNYIGTDSSGSASSPNDIGIGVTGCSNCIIGGVTAPDRNLISGNTSAGVAANSTTGLAIQGNYIGTKANGLESLANNVGINLVNAPNTLVGGTAAGAGNVITTTAGISVYAETSDDVSILGNFAGVGADGTTPLGGGDGIYGLSSARLTIGATSAASGNKISHFGAAILLDNVTGGLSIRGNSMEDNDFAIDIGDPPQTAPAVTAAQVLNGDLYITFSLSSSSSTATTQSMQLDLYDADTTPGAAAEGKTFRTSSPCYSGSALTNQKWAVGSGYGVGDKIVFAATSFSDANCTTPGDGSSPFTSVITTTAPNTFTGPGSFSDTTKWSNASLPAAGDPFVILGSCIFDNGVPVRAYAAMTVGNGTTSGNLSWQNGNSIVLDVETLTVGAGNSGTAVDMSNGGSLRVRGSMTVGTSDFAGGTGTVELAGTGTIVTSNNAVFHNITVTGSVAVGNQVYFDGTLDVQSGATFSGSSGTFLRPQNGASITGSGTKSFGTVAVGGSATVTASGSFSVSTAFSVDGTFTPDSATVITGTGLTFTPAGTIRVTRNGSNALTNQFAFSSVDTTNNTTEYAGTANQTINSGRTFKNLTINNPVTVQLLGNLTVTGVLNLAQGLAMGSGNEFFVTNSAVGAVVQGTGWTRLNIHRAIATGTNTYLFPLGPGGGSQPVYVTFHDVTVAAQVRMQAITQNANQLGGNPGIDTSKDVGNTWTLQVESGTVTSYDLTINFGTMYDAGADPARFVLRRQDAQTEIWTPLSATAGATSISTTGETMTATHFYAAGQQAIDHYVVSASSPQSTGVAFDTTVTAQDVFNVTANVDGTVVTMTSNTGNAQFDSNGDSTFGDNTKSLTNGTFTISTKDDVGEVVTITATDANSKTGSSSAITIDYTITPPTNLLATATSTSNVGLTWTFAPGATGYEIWRSSLNSAYALAGTTSGTSFNDTTVSANTTYLYRLKAVFSGGTSGFGSVDAATTVLFTDTTLTSSIAVKAVHLTELRTAVNAMRAAAGLGAATFTDPTLTAGTTRVKAAHVSELRTALDAARSGIGLTPITYTDATITASTTTIKGAHVTELRSGTQ
jgi:hypothetical protein